MESWLMHTAITGLLLTISGVILLKLQQQHNATMLDWVALGFTGPTIMKYAVPEVSNLFCVFAHLSFSKELIWREKKDGIVELEDSILPFNGAYVLIWAQYNCNLEKFKDD